MKSTKLLPSAGVGLLAGVVASVLTGQWWLVAVGLILGAGAGRAADRKR
jgi:hypothetical protein